MYEGKEERQPSNESNNLVVGRIEFRDSGNTVVVIDAGKEVLVEAGARISVLLDHTPIKSIETHLDRATVALSEGNELRPGGCFAVYIGKQKGKEQLVVDNRNARGVPTYIDELRAAVEAVVEVKSPY